MLSLSSSESQIATPAEVAQVWWGPWWIKRGFGLFLVFILAPVLLVGCWEEDTAWDPEVVALVNGRPVLRSAVERVLKWGAYPGIGQGEASLESIAVPNILAQLIDEQLILEAAQQSGIGVSRAERDEVLDRLASDWTEAGLTDTELDELKIALENQLILRKMTEKIIADNQVLSADAWQAFWDSWPKTKLPRYLVRVLLVPPVPDVSGLGLNQRGDLELMADNIRKKEMQAVVSEPVWISGPDQKSEVVLALEEALALGRLTEPLRLEESWAVYEVLDIDRGRPPLEDYRSARASFEELAGEKIFHDWLVDKRAEADIKIDPVIGKITYE